MLEESELANIFERYLEDIYFRVNATSIIDGILQVTASKYLVFFIFQDKPKYLKLNKEEAIWWTERIRTLAVQLSIFLRFHAC